MRMAAFDSSNDVKAILRHKEDNIPMADEIRMSDITFSDPSSYDGGLTNLSHKKDDYLSPQQAIQSSSSTPGKSGNKIGHRRIDKQGEVSYKRVPTNALMGAIQLGIANSVGSLAGKPRRDILVQDFEVIESVTFPTDGSQMTPSHQYGDFRFKSYAPIAFRYFRELFNIKPADFLKSLCTLPLRELSNPGASGSIFYVSTDDKFIIKTVQHKEAEFLRKLLPGYYMNLHQNPRTLLPKFFGLFCYQSLGKNIRLLVMNNLLPQSVEMHHKFDLKGSTYKRHASKSEREKRSPTLKDLDFNAEFTDGIMLDAHIYDILVDVIKRDCFVLESFKIMDYSMLMGVHNIDAQQHASNHNRLPAAWDAEEAAIAETWRSLQLDYSTTRGPQDDGGVPAKNAKGERLLLYLGIIDILQNYRLFKKLEHTFKSVLHDGETISVTNPGFYANRFTSYISTIVFRRVQDSTGQTSRHPASNKFRSLVHSYIAMKSTPVRIHTTPQQQQQLQNRRVVSTSEYIDNIDLNNQQQQLNISITPSSNAVKERFPSFIEQRDIKNRRSYTMIKTSHLGVGASGVGNEFEKQRRKVDRLFAASNKQREGSISINTVLGDEDGSIKSIRQQLQSTQV
uniref:PIPK domain-containing protein n=1 Tax=Meloidogyne enterolobii TaxID=390850 RepID=A0A6V7WSR1_MELEN|nr:unnamed protein product [Meloidogyne enterolobii]